MSSIFSGGGMGFSITRVKSRKFLSIKFILKSCSLLTSLCISINMAIFKIIAITTIDGFFVFSRIFN